MVIKADLVFGINLKERTTCLTCDSKVFSPDSRNPIIYLGLQDFV